MSVTEASTASSERPPPRGKPRSAVERCTDWGVTERPPMPGQSYAAYIVHPRQPGPITLGIAHMAGGKFIVDLVREGLTIQQSVDLAKAYGVSTVFGAEEGGDGLNLAHAVLGVISLLRERGYD